MKADTPDTFPRCLAVLARETREEALANIEEAIVLYLEPADDDPSYEPDVEVVEIAV